MIKMSRKDKEKWKQISTEPLTECFIIENKDKLDFKSVCKCSYLTRHTIEELKDDMDWANIVLYQKHIDREFIWNNSCKVNWDKVSNSPDLTEKHLEDFPDYLNWKIVLAKHKYSEETLLKYVKFVDWQQACITQDLSTNFLEENAVLLYPYKYEICKYQKLEIPYMMAHKDTLDWDIISECQQLPEWFIDKMSDYVNWIWISKKQKLSKKFILDHIDKISLISMINSKKYIPKEIKDSDYYHVCLSYKSKFSEV